MPQPQSIFESGIKDDTLTSEGWRASLAALRVSGLPSWLKNSGIALIGDLPAPWFGSAIMSIWESVVDAEVGEVRRPRFGWKFVDTMGGIIFGSSFSIGATAGSGEGGGRENSWGGGKCILLSSSRRGMKLSGGIAESGTYGEGEAFGGRISSGSFGIGWIGWLTGGTGSGGTEGDGGICEGSLGDTLLGISECGREIWGCDIWLGVGELNERGGPARAIFSSSDWASFSPSW